METATLKKPDAATRRRETAILELRTAGAIADALRELRKGRPLTESERRELAIAEEDESMYRMQLQYRGGHAFLGVSGDREYADLPNPEEVETRYTAPRAEPLVHVNAVGMRIVTYTPERKRESSADSYARRQAELKRQTMAAITR